jgi:hypothetical protein
MEVEREAYIQEFGSRDVLRECPHGCLTGRQAL